MMMEISGLLLKSIQLLNQKNITLVKDQDNLAYIQDSQDNYQPLIYFDQHITIDTFGQDWKILAAENIDGINSVIWKFTDSFYGGADSSG